jgi:hypothetical protein
MKQHQPNTTETTHGGKWTSMRKFEGGKDTIAENPNGRAKQTTTCDI